MNEKCLLTISDFFQDHVHDIHAFVRSKYLQIWLHIVNEKCLLTISDFFQDHVHDIHAFVRSKYLQIWLHIVNEKCLLTISDFFQDHVHDIHAFVRSKVLQIWLHIVNEKCLPLPHQENILQLVIGRLQDKSSQVRKYAIQLITTLLKNNPFASKVKPVIFFTCASCVFYS